MDILILCLLYTLFVVNFLSICCKKKLQESEKSDHDRKDRREKKDVEDPVMKEQPGPEPFRPPDFTFPNMLDQQPAISTAQDVDDPQEDRFKCRDYTPAMFNDLQQLFDLLKR